MPDFLKGLSTIIQIVYYIRESRIWYHS